MSATFQIIALSSLDPDGSDRENEPHLSYPDAIKAAEELKAQGKAFRVFANDSEGNAQLQAFADMGALV